MPTYSASDYLEGQIINHLFRTAAMPKPANLYFALFTAAPSDSGGGTEVSGGSYQRVSVTVSDSNFTAPTAGDGKTKNIHAIQFPYPSARWGTVTHWGVFDAPTGGNLLFLGNMTSGMTMSAGDPPLIFMPGDWALTVD